MSKHNGPRRAVSPITARNRTGALQWRCPLRRRYRLIRPSSDKSQGDPAESASPAGRCSPPALDRRRPRPDGRSGADVAQQVKRRRLPSVVLPQLGEMGADRVSLPATKLALFARSAPEPHEDPELLLREGCSQELCKRRAGRQSGSQAFRDLSTIKVRVRPPWFIFLCRVDPQERLEPCADAQAPHALLRQKPAIPPAQTQSHLFGARYGR
jgi:hypothetical protein